MSLEFSSVISLSFRALEKISLTIMIRPKNILTSAMECVFMVSMIAIKMIRNILYKMAKAFLCTGFICDGKVEVESALCEDAVRLKRIIVV